MFVWGYAHVLLASLLTGGMLMLAVSAWHLRRGSSPAAFLRTAKLSLVVLLPTSVLVLMVGSHLGVVETTYQPMKVAAMEAQWDTCSPCSFSAAQTGGWTSSDQEANKIIEIPHLLSILATGSFDGEVTGLNELQAQYEKEYGPGDYIPNLPIQYWSMRVMAYLASVVPLLVLWGLWLWRRGRLERSRAFLTVATWSVLAPFVMNTAGWLLTENGRQPWIVQGLLLTEDGNSPSVSAGEVATTLVMFWVIYLVLGWVWVFLMRRYARRGLDEVGDGPGIGGPTSPSDAEPAVLTY